MAVNTNHWFTDGTQKHLEGPSFLIQLWGEKKTKNTPHHEEKTQTIFSKSQQKWKIRSKSSSHFKGFLWIMLFEISTLYLEGGGLQWVTQEREISITFKEGFSQMWSTAKKQTQTSLFLVLHRVSDTQTLHILNRRLCSRKGQTCLE